MFLSRINTFKSNADILEFRPSGIGKIVDLRFQKGLSNSENTLRESRRLHFCLGISMLLLLMNLQSD